MVMAAQTEIIKKLDFIKSELNFIKEQVVGIDSIMSEEDYEELLAYRKEKSTGKLISHF